MSRGKIAFYIGLYYNIINEYLTKLGNCDNIKYNKVKGGIYGDFS